MKDQTVCQQQDALITYLYEECEPAERVRFDAHLETCAQCAAELESLRGIRGTLETWAPPEMNLGVRIVADRPVTSRPWWRESLQPSWGLVAAGAVVVVVAAAVASVEIRFGDGFVFRMGWAGPATVPPAQTAQTGSIPTVGGTGVGAPADDDRQVVSRAEFVAFGDALRRELRADLEAAGSVTGAVPVEQVSDAERAVGGQYGRTPSAGVQWNDAEMLQRFQMVVNQSEQRQRQELAMWLTEFTREYDMQRLADQRQVHQQLGVIEDGVNEYLVRASQQP